MISHKRPKGKVNVAEDVISRFIRESRVHACANFFSGFQGSDQAFMVGFTKHCMIMTLACCFAYFVICGYLFGGLFFSYMSSRCWSRSKGVSIGEVSLKSYFVHHTSGIFHGSGSEMWVMIIECFAFCPCLYVSIYAALSFTNPPQQQHSPYYS